MSDLRSHLEPITAFLAEQDLSSPETVESELATRFRPGGETWTTIDETARRALAEGAICDRGEAPVRYSRIVKPEQDLHGFSIDAVVLESTAGPRHTHPRGEVSLCVVLDGAPEFEGRPSPTWVVLPPGSSHVPEARNGTILFLYWWPGGEVVWE